MAGLGKREVENYPRFLEVAELLLAWGASLSAAAATALGRKEVLRAMLAERLVELADETDWLKGGLLTVAVRHGRREVAQLLLDSGWDINESTRLRGIERGAFSSGCPLWQAADNQDYGMAEMLLECGADANALVYASGNALSRAYNRRDERMRELLCRYGAEADPETLGLFRDTVGAREFLGSDRTEQEISRLLWASACGGDPETVRMCLQRLSWPPTDKQ